MDLERSSGIRSQKCDSGQVCFMELEHLQLNHYQTRIQTKMSLLGVAVWWCIACTHTQQASPAWVFHAISTARHNGGVRVGAFRCVLTVLPPLPTPPFTTQVTSAIFLAKWIAPVSMESLYSESKHGLPFQTNATPLLAHTYAACHSLTRTLWNYHPRDVMMWAYCIDAARCHFAFVIHG